MENFFNYITKPIPPEDVEVWFRVNNIIPEKLELYSDFSHSLNSLISQTYLGQNTISNETKIILSDKDNLNHFDWCWKKTIENFKKENINFHLKGSHYDYFESFYDEIFYHQKEEKVRLSVGEFFTDLFNLDKTFTKSDLEMILMIYKVLNNSLKT
jgi:hypothetical protein